MLASAGISCRRVSVCLSITSQCSTETAKCSITQIMPHDSPGTFLTPKISAKLKQDHPNRGAKCRCHRLNAGVVADNWRLSMQSVVNWAQSQVYHTEHPCSLFAARSPWCSGSRGLFSWSLSLVGIRASSSLQCNDTVVWATGKPVRNLLQSLPVVFFLDTQWPNLE